MAKKIKDKWLGARADDILMEKVKHYIEAADTDMAELVRASVIEYMENHPAKKPREPVNLKPGA